MEQRGVDREEALRAAPLDLGDGMVGEIERCLSGRAVLRLHGHAPDHRTDEARKGVEPGMGRRSRA
ncbi:hypothetical protein GAY31_11020 [Azospirillum brasilense]|nr:hypothetical protein [Azospirillum brasilense]